MEYLIKRLSNFSFVKLSLGLLALIAFIGFIILRLSPSDGESSAAGKSDSQLISPMMDGAIQGKPLNLTAVVSTLAGSGSVGSLDDSGKAASFNEPIGMTTDGRNLYVADSGNNAIRKITISTGEVSTLTGSFNYPMGITTDGKYLYVADTNNHVIRKIVISTGEVSTLAGKELSWGDLDAYGTSARFQSPVGLALAGDALYVADSRNDKIRKVILATGKVTTLAGSGNVDAIGIAASFYRPSGLATDGQNLYVADGTRKIRKIILATGKVTTLAGSGNLYSTDGSGPAASFAEPFGLVLDGNTLYVVDSKHPKIRKIEITTGMVSTMAGTGFKGVVNATGTEASFNYPHGITIDKGNMYVADTANDRIRKIEIATGVVSTFTGTGARAFVDGTVAKMKPSFNEPVDLITDGNNLYVADTNNNKIRKISLETGMVSTLAGSGTSDSLDATGTAASFSFPSGITSDGSNLYVADKGNNTIRRIVIATGTVTTLAGSKAYGVLDGIGISALFNQPRGITTDGSNLYVADTGNNKIRKIVIATGMVTTLAGQGRGKTDGIGTAASFDYPSGITTDGTNLYVADSHNHTIRKIGIANSAVTTLAGSSKTASTGGKVVGYGDGKGTEASFYNPTGITTDGNNLYVADTKNYTIRKIVIASGLVTTLAGYAVTNSARLIRSYGSVDGKGEAARFFEPNGVTTDGRNLYVADTKHHNIRKIVASTGVVTTLAGLSGVRGSNDGSNMAGAAASFNEFFGITSDGDNLYVSDTINNKIRKVVIATGVVSTLAGSGIEGSLDAKGTAATFNGPFGITTDGKNLYVADTMNHKIRQIEISTARVTTLAGSGKKGFLDEHEGEATFNHPAGVTTDGINLYVADTYNHTIRKIEFATRKVTTLAGSGKAGVKDGAGSSAAFHYPFGISSDGNNLYVADTYNQTIRKIVLKTGNVSTLAGSGTPGFGDGLGPSASFNYPNGISTDGSNLYVVDTANHKIRKIVIATGEVVTLAGYGKLGLLDAPGASALFNNPRGITTDGQFLYVADTDNHVIRKIK